MLAEVVRAAHQAGAETTVLELAGRKVGPCVACDACHKTGQCPIPDDFATFRDAMLAADGVYPGQP